jgi:membrane protease YdiL (CAAX protease family)
MSDEGPDFEEMRRRGRARARRQTLDLARYLGMFFVWNIGASLALLLGLWTSIPFLSLGLITWLGVWIVRGYLLGGRGGARRRALIRPRALSRPVLRWTLVAIPVMIFASWSLGEVWFHLVPVPPDSIQPFDFLTGNLTGKITLAILAVAFAPVIEEFFFRGLLQSTIAKYNGPAAGILLSATAFAAAHFLPWIFPIHFFLGAAFGYAVYVTRSIWPGVILHAANNLAALAGLVESDTPSITPTIWQTGLTRDWWLAVVAFALAIFLLVYTGRRLRDAARLRPHFTHG